MSDSLPMYPDENNLSWHSGLLLLQNAVPYLDLYAFIPESRKNFNDISIEAETFT